MIDVTTLTDLITQFRNTTAANSVSPGTVGSILQKIVDILATAGTQANLDIINKWHEALKTARPALTALSQGNADRNHVYLAARSVNLYTGAQADLTPIQIQQATTERAGAMRAQQVVDLNAARRDVADIKKQIQTINSLLGVGTADNLYKTSQISCQVVNGELHLFGAQTLTAAGYVPYLFRRVRKRNPYKNKFATTHNTQNSLSVSLIYQLSVPLKIPKFIITITSFAIILPPSKFFIIIQRAANRAICNPSLHHQ